MAQMKKIFQALDRHTILVIRIPSVLICLNGFHPHRSTYSLLRLTTRVDMYLKLLQTEALMCIFSHSVMFGTAIELLQLI